MIVKMYLIIKKLRNQLEKKELVIILFPIYFLDFRLVRELLQILISDELVKCEKIGSGNFYWSFLSETLMQLQKKKKIFEKSIPGLEKVACELQAKLDEATILREKTTER